jgi:ElaB/YqjD/DUF883 family membrane-anchored ribosome-binding protein
MEEEVKVAVLGQKLEDLKHIVIKIDAAIEKLSEVNTNVIKMLAVHDERIEYQQKTDDLILKMIDNLKEENQKEHKKTSDRIDDLEEQVGEISKIKWMTVGTGAVLTVLVALFASLASGWFTPSGMEDHRRIEQTRIK